MAIWNMVDNATPSIPNWPRDFHLPLASIAPGNATVRKVEPDQFEPSDERIDGGKDLIFNISIRPPRGGAFADEGTLPDPAFRLHAMARGYVTFQPADATNSARLTLNMLTYFGSITQKSEIFWWDRWLEAGCVPAEIIYENVDPTELQNRLDALSLGESSYGLKLPLEIASEAEQATFITNFMAGQGAHPLTVEEGAYLGVAATDPANTDHRLLKMRGRYQGHTEANPFVMNPREFFYLLFGDDSQEAKTHPLMQAINRVGLSQSGNESKTMRLRPPLRTSKRLEWEARQEIDHHAAAWMPTPALSSHRFYNTITRNGRTLTHSGFGNANKCNLFTSDIAVRAGFRVGLHPVESDVWHYVDSNSHANLVLHAAGNEERVALQGRAEDAQRTWGWKIENWMRAQGAAQLQQKLNEAIAEEGRCFVLSGARARRFVETTCGSKKGICNCVDSLRPNGIGHIVLVKEVLAQPKMADAVGAGLKSIRVRTLEASDHGAVSRDTTFSLGGASSNAASPMGFIRLHLFELHPGRDPDTSDGLNDLNVHSENRNRMGTANEAAADTKLTHMPDGADRKDNVKCHDVWPAKGNPTEV